MNFRLPPLRRYLAHGTWALYSTTPGRLRPTGSIYVSRSTDPYFNLSLEDWLFRNKSHHEPLLLMYRDDPCVVIGRNQNPWKEVNLQLAAVRDIPFIRRRSGGGTVYHDLGNTNYSIHLPRSSFDRNVTASVVVRALRSLDVDAEVNDRNDICIEGFKMSSAYKIVNNRAYHHGTMLVSTKLDTLGDLLHTTKDTMITKGVASVRSPVRNLREFRPELTHDDFVQAVISSFQDEYGILDEPSFVTESEGLLDMKAIGHGMDELKTWDWQYGQTPEFRYEVTQTFQWGDARAIILSRHGIILSCTIQCAVVALEALETIGRHVQGGRYGFVGEFQDDWWQGSKTESPKLQELWNWLREEMNPYVDKAQLEKGL